MVHFPFTVPCGIWLKLDSADFLLLLHSTLLTFLQVNPKSTPSIKNSVHKYSYLRLCFQATCLKTRVYSDMSDMLWDQTFLHSGRQILTKSLNEEFTQIPNVHKAKVSRTTTTKMSVLFGAESLPIQHSYCHFHF